MSEAGDYRDVGGIFGSFAGDVILKHTGDGGVIALMRCFTFAVPPAEDEALRQRTGHRRTRGRSIFTFMGKAFVC